MDKCIHKTKPPNFGGFFVASHKTKPLNVGAYQGFLLSSRREITKGTCLNFSIKTPAKIIMEIKGNMTEQDAGFCGKVFVFAISISCIALGVGLAVSAIIFALRW